MAEHAQGATSASVGSGMVRMSDRSANGSPEGTLSQYRQVRPSRRADRLDLACLSHPYALQFGRRSVGGTPPLRPTEPSKSPT